MNGFNDEDMANRYDLGFEDGKLSAEKEIEQLRAENERLRAALGRVIELLDECQCDHGDCSRCEAVRIAMAARKGEHDA